MSLEQATAYKNEGNKAFQENRFQDAIDAFTKAIEINPNDHVFYSNRSGAYASLNKLEEALSDAVKCVQIKPDWAKGYQRKGHAEYELGKLTEAVATFKKGLEYEPSNAILKERLSKVEEELKEESAGGSGGQFDSIATQIMMKLAANPRTAEWLKDPSFMTKLEMLKKSPQMFSVLMQQDPRLGEAFNLLLSDFGGGAAFNQGANFNFQDKKNAEEQKPETKEHTTTSTTNQNQDDFKMEEEIPEPFTNNAKQEAPKPAPKKEEQKKPAPAPASNLPEHEKVKNEGNEFYKSRNFEKALECYNKAIELQPSEILYYNNKAAVYIEQKNYDAALETVELALKVAHDNSIKDFQKIAKIFARKASILAKQEKYTEALQWYDKSLLEDNNPKVKLEMKQIEKIKKEADAQAYINPALAEEHNEKAKAFFTDGKFPQALQEYNECIKRNPKEAKYYCNRGICYQKLMEFPSGLRDLDKCLEIDPNYIKAYIKKGQCHTAMKEFHKALGVYEKGLKIQPDNQELKELLERTRMQAYVGGGDEKEQQERAQHAMADPEIQQILRTPEVQNALKSLQQDPKEATKILSDPYLAPKIAKLVEAGILRMG
ncbi:hypothetical protein ABPG74_010114 [Tetrahymena malaccensis]